MQSRKQDLNTSHVNVQQLECGTSKTNKPNLNTSYVNVQRAKLGGHCNGKAI